MANRNKQNKVESDRFQAFFTLVNQSYDGKKRRCPGLLVQKRMCAKNRY